MTASSPPIAVISAMGLSTAVAPMLAGNLTAVDEQTIAYFENPRFINRAYEPQICAFRNKEAVSTLEARSRTLMQEALVDFRLQLTSRYAPGSSLWKGPVHVGLLMPEIDTRIERDSDRLNSLAIALLRDLSSLVSETFGCAIATKGVLFEGAPGLGTALGQFVAAVGEGSTAPLILAAVDSWSDRLRLNAANDAGLLFSRKDNYGFVPGEAAGVALVVGGSTASADGIAQLIGSATSAEENTETSGTESFFYGLSRACHDAISQPGRQLVVGDWIADFNNSRYRASELSYAMVRLSETLAPALQPLYPSLWFGDCGAAFGLVATACALSRRRRMPNMGPALITSGTSGQRSAIVLA